MIRELASAVILVGAMLATEARTNVASDTYNQLAQPVVTLLSSRDGWGVGVKVSPARLGAVEAHYAMTGRGGDWAFSMLPKFGLSVADGVKELPQGVQFSMGLQGLISYRTMTIGVEYWHMSAGSAIGLAVTDKQNIGLDIIALQTGWTF